MSASRSYLAVDLGTTWTAAGVSTGGQAEPIMLGSNGPSMPSVVAVVNGEVVAGEAAARAAAVDPASSAREFKRRLGDTSPIVLAGTPYGAETLMGHLLGHVLEVATAQAGAPSAVTLTHPAVFGEYKLDLLREAARVAGVGNVGLLSEPEAAALHYARLGRLAAGDTVAVYDFGGGTFDAAIVRLENDGPRLLGRPEGLERLGGIDLDHAVLAHVDASLDGALSQLDTSDPAVRRAVLALRQQCVDAKEALSADTEVGIPVNVPGLDTIVRVTRAEFESFVRPRLSETLGALDRAIASAGLTAGDLAGVVLVGGSSRIPIVVEQVASHTGRPLLVDADPKLVVALGAVPSTERLSAPEEDEMSTTTPPAANEPASSPAAEAPKDAPAKDAAAEAAAKRQGGSRERRTAPGQREPEKGGMSTAGKVAAGVAAAGLAGATAAFWRDDVANAVGLGDDDGPDPAVAPQPGVDAAAAAAAEAVPDVTPPPAEESMDAFDAIADAPPAPGPGAGPRVVAPSGGGGGGGGQRQAARVDIDDGPAPAGPAPRVAPPQSAPFTPQQGAPVASAATQTAPPPGASTSGPVTVTPPQTGAPTHTGSTQTGMPPQTGGSTTAGPQTMPPSQTSGPGTDGPTGMPTDMGSGDMPTDMGSGDMDPDFASARAQLQQRLADWQPPEGADPAEVSDLRARLDGLLNRYEPRPGQSVDQAIAELRDEFELRIDNFVQDEKIDALVEELQQQPDGAPMAPDPAFEARRDALRESLTNWQAPEGTTPEDAAELKAQLQSLVDSYQPGPGQTADEALAALRAQFDDQVQDFVQDQKIDALVEEVEDLRAGAGMPEPDPEFESRRDALRESLTNWQAPEGTSPEDAAELKAQLQSLVDSYQPQAGQSADEALAALRAQFDDQVQDFVQDQKIDALVEEQMADNAADAAAGTATDATSPDMAAGGMSAGDTTPGMGGGMTPDDTTPDTGTDGTTPGMGEPDPRVSMPRDVLTDDFDDMIGEVKIAVPDGDAMPGIAIGEMDPTARPVGDSPGVAMGEPTPGQPMGDVDMPDALGSPAIDDDIFNIGDLDTSASGDGDLGSMFQNTGIVPPHITDAGAALDPDGLDSLPDLSLPDIDDDLALPDLDDRLTPSLDDLPSMDDDMPSLVPDHDDDLDLGGGMGADDIDDPLGGI